MKLNIGELISRTTQVNARSLTLLSSILIVVGVFELKPIQWPLLDQPLPFSVFQGVSLVVLSYLTASLFVSWSADRTVYLNWFNSNRVDDGTKYGLSGKENSVPIVKGLKDRIEQLDEFLARFDNHIEEASRLEIKTEKSFEDEHEAQKAHSGANQLLEDVKSSVQGLKGQLCHLEEFMDELPSNFRKVNILAIFILCFWYLALPVFLCFAALLVTLDYFQGMQDLLRNWSLSK